MVHAPTSRLFDSFVEKRQVHKELCRNIADATESIADTIARTRQTIAESRVLLATAAKIAEQQ
jgi:hypothetical protein